METISGTAEAWKRVGRAVRARRIQLGIHSQADLYAAGGPGIATISKIERGGKTNYEDQIIWRLESALQWEPGSIQAILRGGEPTAQSTPDSVTVDTGARFQANREYPPLVGTDPGFRALYDRLEGLLTHDERMWAIRAVVMYRASMADAAATRDRDAFEEPNAGRRE